MAQYTVIAYNIPKVSEDGKQALPIPPGLTQEFSEQEAAQQFAATNRTAYDRVLVMGASEDSEKLIERYRDGQHELAEKIVRR